MAHVWTPIDDLPQPRNGMASTELGALVRLWCEQREQVDDTDVGREFRARLCREWAIETGIIERLYDLDRGMTEILIEHGIDAALIPHGGSNKPAETVASLISDQHQAIEGLFSFVKSARGLSVSYVCELHQVLTRHQPTTVGRTPDGTLIEVPLVSGDWKQQVNDPTRPDGSVHEYCPPEHVAAEMDRLIEMHHAHTSDGVPPEVEAAWLHHRFTQIHPFQDGNGRVARCLATLVFLRAECLPLVVRNSVRDGYLEALEAADAGDLGTLVSFFTQIQKAELLRVLALGTEARDERRPVMQEVIASAAGKLQQRRRKAEAQQERVLDRAQPLIELADQRLQDLRGRLHEELRAADEGFHAGLTWAQADSTHWYKAQIVQAARGLGYWANTSGYHHWFRLKLFWGEQTEIVISLHGFGEHFRGILAWSALSFRRFETDEDRTQTSEAVVACREPFQFNYLDDDADLRVRFSAWLEEALAAALSDWERQL